MTPPSTSRTRLAATLKVVAGTALLVLSVYFTFGGEIEATKSIGKAFVMVAAFAILLAISGLVELITGRRWIDLPQGMRVGVLVILGGAAVIWLFVQAFY